MPLPAGLRALGQRHYRLYFTGQIVGQSGTWMQTVTQSWLVLQLTNSPLKLGLIATLQSGPLLLLTLFTGVLAFWLGDDSAHQEDTLAALDQALKMFVRSLPAPPGGGPP